MNDKALEREQINHFKRELKSVKYLMNQADEYLKIFEEAEHKLLNVKSAFKSENEKSTSSSTFDQRFSYWLNKKQKALFDYRKFQSRVDDVIETLEKMDPIERKIITDIYMKGRSFDYISLKYELTRRELQNLVDQTIKYYISDEKKDKCKTRDLLDN